MGETTGVEEVKIKSMEIENKKVDKVEKGLVGVKIDRLVRKGDKVYLYENRKLLNKGAQRSPYKPSATTD